MLVCMRIIVAVYSSDACTLLRILAAMLICSVSMHVQYSTQHVQKSVVCEVSEQFVSIL
jgi:hypothetical protein